MKKLKLLIVSFAVLLIATSAFADKHQDVAIGNEMPPMVIKTDSMDISLPSLRGKWVILSFWSASDAGSRMAQNRMVTITRQLTQNNLNTPVEMVSVNFDRSEQLMHEIINIDQLSSEMQFHIKDKDEIATLRKTLRMDNALRTFVINPQGELTSVDPTEDELRQIFFNA
ncbi:MAG: redoxin domain-containing protein [Bacteroidales bacterium]|nr:redoxin domain-containing protein [Bacteroidales bacterium]